MSGGQPSWDHRALFTREGSFSWTSPSHPTTPSNHPRSAPTATLWPQMVYSFSAIVLLSSCVENSCFNVISTANMIFWKSGVLLQAFTSSLFIFSIHSVLAFSWNVPCGVFSVVEWMSLSSVWNVLLDISLCFLEPNFPLTCFHFEFWLHLSLSFCLFPPPFFHSLFLSLFLSELCKNQLYCLTADSNKSTGSSSAQCSQRAQVFCPTVICSQSFRHYSTWYMLHWSFAVYYRLLLELFSSP